MQNFQVIPIRASAILVASTYVAGTIIGRNTTQPNFVTTYTNDQLDLYINFTIGSLTSAQVKVDFATELFYPLAYDGQSANFTAGLTVTGATSGATGVIVADADSGATGTLTLKTVLPGPKGYYFIDNEVLTDSSTGAAVVNGAMSPLTATTDDACWMQESFNTPTATSALATSTVVVNEYSFANSGRYRLLVPIKDQYIRVSAKGTGTATNSLMDITGIIGTTGGQAGSI